MAWLTEANITAAISEADLILLTDDTGAGTVNATYLNAIIANVGALVGAMLYDRYPVNVAAETDSAMITDICINLAVEQLAGRRFSIGVPNSWIERISAARDNLSAIQDGTMMVKEWSDTTYFGQDEVEYQEIDTEIVAWETNRTEFTL